jgi:hypothetical protein
MCGSQDSKYEDNCLLKVTGLVQGHSCRGKAEGGRWYSHPRQQSPRGRKMDAPKLIFSVKTFDLLHSTTLK